MAGYIETLTDPSYYGQIVLQTFPLIGNYGIIEDDFEGACCVKGYVVRDWCDTPSNFRCQYDLDTYLKEQGVVGLYGIDTREVTRIIRESGVMNAIICDQIPKNLDEVKAYTVQNAVRSVSRTQTSLYPAIGEKKFQVTMIDYGAKQNIIHELQIRGCDVKVVPYNTSAESILAGKPDGIMLSNGPGDPQENTTSIAELRKLIGKLPIFGICLGHQLMALAMGGQTIKLKYGHRGVNQPAKETNGNRTYVTSQNHGYAVVAESLAGKGTPSFINANDGTCEGMEYPQCNAFTVQFHPEADSGPHDTEFLFDRFLTNMKNFKGGND
jgi:carbamoyl-phosphate synthase small subunit